MEKKEETHEIIVVVLYAGALVLMCFLALYEYCWEFCIKYNRRSNYPFCTVFVRRNNNPIDYGANNIAARMDNVYVITNPTMLYSSQ